MNYKIMFKEFYRQKRENEALAAQEVAVSDEAIVLAKEIVFLSREPAHVPNPTLKEAIGKLAVELGVPELESREVQEKAFEIQRQLD